jgi:carbon storage regulator
MATRDGKAHLLLLSGNQPTYDARELMNFFSTERFSTLNAPSEGSAMLVLSRKPGETIIIGDNIRISVVSIAPGRVKIGIDAPKDVSIHREEIMEAVANGDKAATPAAIVGSAPAPESQRAVEPAADTPTIHNRISDKFPAPVVPPSAPLTQTPPVLENRIAKLRKKPR